MMNPCNPLTTGNLDDDPSEDLEGQTPLQEGANNFEVFSAQLSNINNDELTTHISDTIDPLQESRHLYRLSPNFRAEIRAI